MHGANLNISAKVASGDDDSVGGVILGKESFHFRSS
jgi:hypothetical protein